MDAQANKLVGHILKDIEKKIKKRGTNPPVKTVEEIQDLIELSYCILSKSKKEIVNKKKRKYVHKKKHQPSGCAVIE